MNKQKLTIHEKFIALAAVTVGTLSVLNLASGVSAQVAFGESEYAFFKAARGIGEEPVRLKEDPLIMTKIIVGGLGLLVALGAPGAAKPKGLDRA